MNQQLLNMIESTLVYFRYLVCLLIIIGAVKSLAMMYFNYAVTKLQHKNHYEFVVNDSALRIQTHERLRLSEIEAITSHAKKETALLPIKAEDSRRAS